MTEAKFSPSAAAKRVLRSASTASLATLSPDGAPFASLVTVATDHAGAPILLISRLAVHTQNLARDDRASLLLVEPGGEAGDPLAGARLSLTGRIGGPEETPVVRQRFLAFHYSDAGDLVAAEASAVEHMNADHAEALELCATKLLNLPAGGWRMTGADPEGIDLTNGSRHARLAFPARVTTADGLRKVLTELARTARATP
jgi:putative heme iron utilization protein